MAPELRVLPDDARRLWGDPAERRRALQAVVDTMGTEGPGSVLTVRRIDRAVVEGLRALGFPRGPVRDVVIRGGVGPSGAKRPDCTLEIFGDQMREVMKDAMGADSVFRTWVHESIHGRQPYATDYRREYDRFQGFEEGLAEGLARILVRDRAGMNPRLQSYRSYVAVYESLAAAIGVEPEHLWRQLWERPTGAVRDAFVDTVDALRRDITGQSLTARQRANLQAIADRRLDSKNRLAAAPSEDAMILLWRTVFR